MKSKQLCRYSRPWKFKQAVAGLSPTTRHWGIHFWRIRDFTSRSQKFPQQKRAPSYFTDTLGLKNLNQHWMKPIWPLIFETKSSKKVTATSTLYSFTITFLPHQFQTKALSATTRKTKDTNDWASASLTQSNLKSLRKTCLSNSETKSIFRTKRKNLVITFKKRSSRHFWTYCMPEIFQETMDWANLSTSHSSKHIQVTT